MNRGRDE